MKAAIRFSWAILWCLIAAGFTPAAADETDRTDGREKTDSIDSVVVTATRRETGELDAPQSSTVITAEDIKTHEFKNLAEALDFYAGVAQVSYGGPGAMQYVTIRGSTAEQVLILLDGVRIGGTQGAVDLSLIPIEEIERIEIIRGGASALYGSQAIGGVVNIITKKKRGLGFYVRVENSGYLPAQALTGSGSAEHTEGPDFSDLFDSQKVVLGLSLGNDFFYTVVSGSYVRADNSYVFLDPTDSLRKRDNAQLSGYALNIKCGFLFADCALDLNTYVLYYDRNIPGELGAPTTDAAQTDLKTGGVLRFTTMDSFSDFFKLEISLFCQYAQLNYDEPSSSISSEHKLNSAGTETILVFYPGSALDLICGVSLNFDSLKSSGLGLKQRFYGALFLETVLYLSDSLTLYPVLRSDYYSDFDFSYNFKLGLVWLLDPRSALKANFDRSFRVPGFYDLYWPADTFSQGNPALKPESGYNGDCGYSYTDGKTAGSIFLFTRYISDVILWRANASGKWQPENYGDGLYLGLEGQFQTRFARNLLVQINYTFLYTFVLSGEYTLADNKRLPSLPMHSLDAGIGYDDAVNSFFVSIHYRSLRFLTTENRTYLDPVFYLDIVFRREFGDFFSCFIKINNLFNEYYEYVKDYPLPGFNFTIGFELVYQEKNKGNKIDEN